LNMGSVLIVNVTVKLNVMSFESESMFWIKICKLLKGLIIIVTTFGKTI
jgi:hypothetical protein